MPSIMTDSPKQNRILAALTAEESERLQGDLELVALPSGRILYESGEAMAYAYFPTSCIVSLITTTESGLSAELASTGNDGLIGIPLVLGGETSNQRVVVQSSGNAYRLRAKVMHWELEQGGSLQSLALRYTQALMTQMAQHVICNRHHSVDQQLCRWLLQSLDRLPDNQLSMTQEQIANMLGVRRAAVTEAAGRLQAAGLIQYSRGHIAVTDRIGLEARVCECYGTVKREYDRLNLLAPEGHIRSRTPSSPATLRQWAEAQLQHTRAAQPDAPLDNVRLVHELQVHQIELEMQNEELRTAYDAADALRERAADIYDFAPIGYFTLDPESAILDLNLAGAILLGIKRSEKKNHRFAASVTLEYRPAFKRFIDEVLKAKGKIICEIALLPTEQRPEAMVRIEAISDESGRECRMVVIDISAEKQADKALTEREHYQRALLDNFGSSSVSSVKNPVR
jgi:CRP-like cAMP-binding protein